MLYIFGSLLFSHIATCIILTFYQLNDDRLLNTILLSFQFLMLAIHFIQKIKQIQNPKLAELSRIAIRIGLLILILQRKQTLVQSFLAGSYMQYLLKKESIIVKLIDALSCMFYFIMWGDSNENTITGTLLSLFMVLNVCMKYYIASKKEKESVQQQSTIKAPSPPLIKNQTSPNYSRKVSIDNYKSEPSQDIKFSDQPYLDYYSKIFNSIPDGIIMVNMKKQVIFINKNLKKMMGGMNKKNAFYRLLQMKNVQQRNNELEQIHQFFEPPQFVVNEQECQDYENKTYFKKSTYDESRVDEQSEQRSSYSTQQFETVKKLLDHFIENKSEKIGITKMLCQFPLNQNTLYQVSFKRIDRRSAEFILLIVKDMTSMNLVTLLQSQNKEKSNFLSTVVHEFRTPLQSIKLMVQQIQPMCSEEMVQKYILPILSQLDCFTNLIQDLLDVSVLNAGKFKLDIQQVNLHQLIKETYNIMVVQAYAKNNQLVIDYKGIPEKIYSDPYKIRQILINLLGNAIKFTYDGTITVSGKVYNKSVEITVVDTGLGIAANNQQKLFIAFGKLDDPTNQNPQGIGLGLMISNVLARKLSQDNKGIVAQSDGEGKGSKFSFQVYDHYYDDTKYSYQQESVVRLQRECFQAPQNLVKQYDSSFRMSGLELSQYSRCTCPEILLVDDQPFILQVLKLQLENTGYRVNMAFSGFECIKKVEQFQHGPSCSCKNFKLIVLDVDMPNLSGIETCKRLITMGYTGHILGHSGYQGTDVEEDCLKAGMKAYFVKPLDQTKLQSWLEQNKIII